MNDRPWEVWLVGLGADGKQRPFRHRWTAELWRRVFLRRATSYVKRAELPADPWEEWCAHAEATGHLRPHELEDSYACLASRCGFTTGVKR